MIISIIKNNYQSLKELFRKLKYIFYRLIGTSFFILSHMIKSKEELM